MSAERERRLIETEANLLTGTDVLEWVQERYDNCVRIAAEKTGSDKAGWLADAAYFHAICQLLSQKNLTKG